MKVGSRTGRDRVGWRGGEKRREDESGGRRKWGRGWRKEEEERVEERAEENVDHIQ